MTTLRIKLYQLWLVLTCKCCWVVRFKDSDTEITVKKAILSENIEYEKKALNIAIKRL